MESVFPKITAQWPRGGFSLSRHNPLSSAKSIMPRTFRFASNVKLSFALQESTGRLGKAKPRKL